MDPNFLYALGFLFFFTVLIDHHACEVRGANSTLSYAILEELHTLLGLLVEASLKSANRRQLPTGNELVVVQKTLQPPPVL